MTETDTIPDECYRCGYNLRGIADDQPCPECGLLAERSRRPTDELHDTRPGWLRRLAMGVWMVLLGLLATALWIWRIDDLREWLWKFTTFVPIPATTVGPPSVITSPTTMIITIPNYPAWLPVLSEWLGVLGVAACGLLVVIGLWLLTAREGYAPADRADRPRRIALRLSSVITFLLLIWFLAPVTVLIPLASAPNSAYGLGYWVVLGAITAGVVASVMLLFERLRSLAKRARSAYLAEHCMIVGVGASLSLLYTFAIVRVMQYADRDMINRSAAYRFALLGMGVVVWLFLIWSLYLLIRFALAFTRAHRELKRKWKRDDRSQTGRSGAITGT